MDATRLVGRTLAGYRVDKLVGRGTTGLVYRATQLSLGRVVALKVIAPELLAERDFRSRFFHAARLVSAIEHPNVLPLYEAAESDGLLYLSMRYVEGTDMGALLAEEGALQPGRAANIVWQVGAALDAAHMNGLVHRDVKPANVLMSKSENVYLADFGLVKVFDITIDDEAPGPSNELVGTPNYVSPEQIEGAPVGPLADVYSLGCVLYHALTGEVPFKRENQMATLYAHVNDPPPRASERRPALAPFDEVIARALAKQPEIRFGSAGELATAAVRAADEVLASESQRSPAARAEPPRTTSERTNLNSAMAVITEPAPPPPPPPGREILLEPLYRPIRIPLRRDFRYVHEPLVDHHDVVPFLGNDGAVRVLAERIAHSKGGAFLITGFRGVGKSTVVHRAVETLRIAAAPGAEVLAVHLNVARRMEIDELLFQIVRRLFETLTDEGILDGLNAEAKRSLLVAYTRTSLSFKESRSNSTERGAGLSMGAGSLPVLGAIGPKLDVSGKRSSALATEVSFLAYSDSDAEHDFLRIVTHIRRPETARRGGLRGRLSRQRPAPPWNGRLVVVIDELDKLTDDDEGRQCLELLLASLKNLFTAAGVHFLFVGGPDLHGMAQQANARGNSVYESIFGWQLYVPCVWHGASPLLEQVAAAENIWELDGAEELRDYLEFKSRGIPRLLLMELNALAHWRDGHPQVDLDAVDVARVEFYAGLQRALVDFLQPPEGPNPFALPIDEDRWRLGAHYVTDWILRSQGTSFTIEDIAGSGDDARVDPLLMHDPRKLQALLDHLVVRDILEHLNADLAAQSFVGDVPVDQLPVYRLAGHVQQRLAGFAQASERERADLAPEPAGAEPPASGASDQPRWSAAWGSQLSLGLIADGRYELLEEIGRGATTRSYRARQVSTGAEVALKLLNAPAPGGGFETLELAQARFEREVALVAGWRHPNLARVRDSFGEPDGKRGIVLDYIEGPTLANVIGNGPLPQKAALPIALALLDALEYLENLGVARLDLKPQNIVLAKRETPVIVDFPLAKRVSADGTLSEITARGITVGTPAYAAPEQILGEPVDIRTDLYSLGLILVEMLSGASVRRLSGSDEPISMLLARVVGEEVDISELAVSAGLRAALRRALRLKPDERYAHPAEFREALLNATA